MLSGARIAMRYRVVKPFGTDTEMPVGIKPTGIFVDARNNSTGTARWQSRVLR